MAQASEHEVKKLLDGYAAKITEILLGAWSDWQKSQYTHWRFNRSRANFVWEQIIERALRAFDGDPRIKPLRRNESILFLLDGSLAFRFKKSDETGLTSNIQTQSAFAFHDPEQDLPGMPEVTRVDVVYVLNKLGTAVDDLMVVGRERDKIRWTFSLLAMSSNVIPLPKRVESNEEPSKLVRAKRRPDEDQESGKES